MSFLSLFLAELNIFVNLKFLNLNQHQGFILFIDYCLRHLLIILVNRNWSCLNLFQFQIDSFLNYTKYFWHLNHSSSCSSICFFVFVLIIIHGLLQIKSLFLSWGQDLRLHSKINHSRTLLGFELNYNLAHLALTKSFNSFLIFYCLLFN
jgi:hypothetical protein